MKNLLFIFFLLVALDVWSKKVDSDNLIHRKGLYYEKSSNELFTGKSIGVKQGTIIDGKIEGEWLVFNNGKLWIKSNYKDGKREGEWMRYYGTGELHIKINYKNGKTNGEYIFLNQNGTFKKKGNFKYGKKDGQQFEYYKSGELKKIELYKDGKLLETIEH